MGGGVFVVSWVAGTARLATFLDWFYSNQARYVFRSAYCVNVFDKLFGYQYHLSATLAKRLFNSNFACIILAFLPIVWRLYGANTSQKKIHTVGTALEKGLDSDRMDGTCGVEMSELPKPCGAEVGEMN